MTTQSKEPEGSGTPPAGSQPTTTTPQTKRGVPQTAVTLPPGGQDYSKTGTDGSNGG